MGVDIISNAASVQTTLSLVGFVSLIYGAAYYSGRKKETKKDEFVSEREREFLSGLEMNTQILSLSRELLKEIPYKPDQMELFRKPNDLRYNCVQGGFQTLSKLQPEISQNLKNRLAEYNSLYEEFNVSLRPSLTN